MGMKNGNLRGIAEWIGIMAIVASLIFVGLQLKQSQEIAIAAQYQSRTEAAQSLALAHLEAGYVLRRFKNRVNDGVSAEDISTFHWLWLSQDNHFYQYQSGFITEESWQPQLRNIKQIYSVCELRFVWDWRKNGLRDEFVALVDSLEDPCTSLEIHE